MSIALLIFSIVLLVGFIGLNLLIRKNYVESLTSVEEKSAGFLFYYRNVLNSLLMARFEKSTLVAGAHYASLHLLPLVWGLSFYLRTDANFLVVIVCILWSMQLFQRLFPGAEDASEDDS